MPRVKPPRTVEQGLLGEAHGAQQRGDLRQRPASSSATASAWYRSHRHRAQPRHQGLRPHRQRGEHRPDRGAHGHYACGRSSSTSAAASENGKKFKAVQIGGPSGGCLTAGAPRPAAGLRFPQERRRHHRLRRPGGHGRGHLHGGDRPVLHGASPRRNPAASASPAGRAPSGCWRSWSGSWPNKGTLEDLDLLEELADTITDTALCGLGQSGLQAGACPRSSTSGTSTLRHVVDHRCPICNRRKAPHPTHRRRQCARAAASARKNCPMEAISGDGQVAPHHRSRNSASTAAPAWQAAPSAPSPRHKEG